MSGPRVSWNPTTQHLLSEPMTRFDVFYMLASYNVADIAAAVVAKCPP